jgi:hypothetical protein
MVTDKEHQRNMRRISKGIKANEAEFRKNEMRTSGVSSKSKQVKKVQMASAASRPRL